MLTQIVSTKRERAHVAACHQAGLATRAKCAYFLLDSDACFIDAILRFFEIMSGICRVIENRRIAGLTPLFVPCRYFFSGNSITST